MVGLTTITLKDPKMTKFQSILGYLLVIGIWCTAMQLGYKYYYTPDYEEEEVPVRLEQPEFFLADKPTKELVKEACEYFGLKHSNIVVAQSILETGHYHSENCSKHNNLFGLYNSRRGQYYKFDTWWKSVIAYRDMIQYRLRDNEDYYKFLSRIGYAEDPKYITKVKGIVKRYE